MRLITFNGPRVSATPLYAEVGVLKLFDQVKLMNILYIHKYLNGKLPQDTLKTLKFERTSHSIGTKGNSIGLLKRPNVKTTYYGLNSFSRSSLNQYNELQKHNRNVGLRELRFSKLKSLATDFLLNQYSKIQ